MVLRLAVDARDLASDTRGIGRYTRAILRRLVHRPDIELTLLVFGPFAFRHRAKLRKTIGSDRFHLASHARGCDLIWHPANGTFFSGRARSVVTIHDTVPFRFPDIDPQRQKHQQAPFLRSVRTAARVIAVSQFDKQELIEVFALPEDRIEVIYHGVDPFFTPDLSAPEPEQPYFLFVGDPLTEPRKNFGVLHQAYREAFNGSGPRLVVVGPVDPKLDDVQYAGLAAGDAKGSGDEHLRSLYRNALALCVPSYYETFGMPMVEAMACGTPVIASQGSCLPEIGGHAARYAPPHIPQVWSGALRTVAEEAGVREEMSRAGIEQAQRYDWDESAQRHAELFFSMIGGR
jgi:glycosyltransferase involved in cell wall biosynthesis